MKYLEISHLFKIILFLLLSTSCAFIKTDQLQLSKFEYSEIMKNPDASYVCFDSNISDIKQVIFALSKLDKDRTSPLHVFKRFLRKGYVIGLYDEVIHVLEYAEFIVKKKTIEDGKKNIKDLSRKLKHIIQKVLNNELYFDVKNIIYQKNIKDFIIDEYNIIQKSPIIFNETIAAKNNLMEH